jgi:hypothetical protein
MSFYFGMEGHRNPFSTKNTSLQLLTPASFSLFCNHSFCHLSFIIIICIQTSCQELVSTWLFIATVTLFWLCVILLPIYYRLLRLYSISISISNTTDKMSDENSHLQLIDRVVKSVEQRTSLLAKLLVGNDGETSSLVSLRHLLYLYVIYKYLYLFIRYCVFIICTPTG